MSLFIAGDPVGNHSLISIQKGYKPENIYVWENDPTHRYAIRRISDRINITNDYHSWDNMHFTVATGNPPYTDTSTVQGATTGGCAGTLDTMFYEWSMDHSDYVSQIIRSKHFAKSTSRFRKKLFTTPGLVSIEALSESVFPSISLTPTAIVTWKRGYDGLSKITYLDGSVKDIKVNKDTCFKFNNPEFVADVPNSMAHRYQRGNLNLNQLKDGDFPMITTMGGFGGEMQIQNVDISQFKCCINQHGVVMNSKYGGKGFGKIRIKPYEHAISGSTIILKTSSEEESERLIEYLNTPEIVNIAIQNKISNSNCKELFRTIPDFI
jgi:hypothetical protein